jgi:hypothetical protein
MHAGVARVGNAPAQVGVQSPGQVGVAAGIGVRGVIGIRFAACHLITVICGTNVSPGAYHRWVTP